MTMPASTRAPRSYPRAKTPSQSHGILYDSSDHFSVLTQLNGSLWPRIIVYCFANVSLMVIGRYLQEEYYKDLEISDEGHNFIAVVVAFLLVSRVNLVLSRFDEARQHLGVMYRETRELISSMAVLSAKGNDDEASKKWRLEIAYRALILLRTSMAVVDYPSDNIAPWNLPELSGEELQNIRNNSYLNPDVRCLAHQQRTEFEESMRVPTWIGYLLKKSICSHSQRLQVPLTAMHETALLASVDGFMGGYYGIRKFLTTPVPFPLIQMARTFLFAYVFTVPFVLLGDESPLLAHCCQVFILTYGFVGLELVAIELDDPFGEDANDFNNLAMAYTTMEDTYLTMRDVDGPEASRKLRERLREVSPNEREEENLIWNSEVTEATELLGRADSC